MSKAFQIPLDEKLGGISWLLNKPDQSFYAWIFQRINGYLIFVNTQKKRGKLQSDFGLSAANRNKLYGDTWKYMGKIDREKYESVAHKARLCYTEKYKDFQYHKSKEPELLKTVKKEIDELTIDSLWL